RHGNGVRVGVIRCGCRVDSLVIITCLGCGVRDVERFPGPTDDLQAGYVSDILRLVDNSLNVERFSTHGSNLQLDVLTLVGADMERALEVAAEQVLGVKF